MLTLIWQLFILFACCAGIGLAFRSFFPSEFSFLQKAVFSLLGGFFLVVLIPQNLFYLGIPVRISAWFVFAVALLPLWLFRHKLLAWIRASWSNTEMRTLALLVLLIVDFHGIVPCQQGVEWYAGKGYPDYYSYVVLAEFLKEEPYNTSEQQSVLQPWLLMPATVLKQGRIGQSILTAEISAWSGTDAKGGYPATVIFFLALLAIALYSMLRETGIDRYMAGTGALLGALLPAVTRLSLDSFLSQAAILFVFPFFVSLFRRQELSPRSLVLFFSLTLAYLIATYSEIAPLGFCTLLFGLMFVRRDTFRAKRLMLMSTVLLIVLLNPFYLRNLIEFLGQQYYIAAHATFLDNMVPTVLSLRGWTELIFGVNVSPLIASFFDYCAILLGVLFFGGIIFLSRRDRLVFGAVLIPVFLLISYLASRTPPSSYPIAKITLTILPFVIGLVFVALAKVGAKKPNRAVSVLKKLFAALMVVSAAAGSARYYSEVFHSQGLLKVLRDSRFLNVCHELEEIKNKRVYIFENDALLTPWLCYHARHNEVSLDRRLISDSPFPLDLALPEIPDLANLDFVATHDRLYDLRVR